MHSSEQGGPPISQLIHNFFFQSRRCSLDQFSVVITVALNGCNYYLPPSLTMEFFRRAKAKKRPDCENFHSFGSDDKEGLRDDHGRTLRRSTKKKEHRETRQPQIQEFPPEYDDEDRSLGETLAPEDHFDLVVPIKPPSRNGILRNRNGSGLLSLPSSMSFSKKRGKIGASDTTSTVSSISCDSKLVHEARKKQMLKQSNSFRSNKSKKAHQLRVVKQTNLPSGVNHGNKEIPATDTKPESSCGNWCTWTNNGNYRMDSQAQKPNYQGPRGTPSHQDHEAALLKSTISPYTSQDFNTNIIPNDETVEQRELPNSSSLHDVPFFFWNFCGPRQLPLEDLLIDSTVLPYSPPPRNALLVYETPLQYEKQKEEVRSLFDPFASYEGDDDAHRSKLRKREPQRSATRVKEMEDRKTSSPTSYDEIGSTMAIIELGDLPMHRKERSDYEQYEYQDGPSFDADEPTWRARLPRKLPKVRSISKIATSLSRIRTFRSSNRSQKSGKSGKSGRSGKSYKTGKSGRSQCRPRQRHEVHPDVVSSQRRPRHSRHMRNKKLASPSNRKHSSRENVATKEYFVDHKGRRTYAP